VILLIQLKQQDKLLQKIEQLKKHKEEGAREIRDLHAQKEILKQQVFNDFFAFSNKINQMKHKYYFVILKIVI
jgi:hypothetical protein